MNWHFYFDVLGVIFFIILFASWLGQRFRISALEGDNIQLHALLRDVNSRGVIHIEECE